MPPSSCWAMPIPSTLRSSITPDDDVPQEVFDLLQDAAGQVRDAWVEETGERANAILAEFDEVRN